MTSCPRLVVHYILTYLSYMEAYSLILNQIMHLVVVKGTHVTWVFGSYNSKLVDDCKNRQQRSCSFPIACLISDEFLLEYIIANNEVTSSNRSSSSFKMPSACVIFLRYLNLEKSS